MSKQNEINPADWGKAPEKGKKGKKGNKRKKGNAPPSSSTPSKKQDPVDISEIVKSIIEYAENSPIAQYQRIAVKLKKSMVTGEEYDHNASYQAGIILHSLEILLKNFNVSKKKTRKPKPK